MLRAVLVNTCGFVEAAKKDSIDTLLAAAELKGDRTQAVVAVGCLAERYGAELAAALPEADAVLGFDDYADVAGSLERILRGERHRSHVPRDRRVLLPITPAERPAAARRLAIPGHTSLDDAAGGAWTGEWSSSGTAPDQWRTVRPAQDRLGLRSAL